MRDEKVYIRDKRSPTPKDEKTSRIMSSIKDRDTGPEVLLRRGLWNAGIRGYRLHWKKIPGRPDIVFVGKKVTVFVNGCFWHRCPHCNPSVPKHNIDFWANKFRKNIERDSKKYDKLTNLGWKVLTFWECQIKDNIDNCINKTKESIT